MGFVVVGNKVFRFDVLLNGFFPSFFTILDEPLIAESNDARIPCPRNYLSLRLEIGSCHVIVDHHLPDNRLCILDQLALDIRLSNNHLALIESFEVYFFFDLCQLFLVLLGGNLHLLAQGNS